MDRARIRNRIQRLTIKYGLQIAQGNGLGTVDCDIWNGFFHGFWKANIKFFHSISQGACQKKSRKMKFS